MNTSKDIQESEVDEVGFEEGKFPLLSEEEEAQKFKSVKLTSANTRDLKSCSFKLSKASYDRYKKLIDTLDVSFNKFCVDAVRYYASARLDHIIAEQEKEYPEAGAERLLKQLEGMKLIKDNEETNEALLMLKEQLRTKKKP
ncbi:hypothetical protein PQO01_05185 [Lentisphaera marina]|uniref:hypothetical protein n=1 Tax=Lentisphaera marina TaxID=1111041 RepID=UPI00236693EB|nr:hypothetical protein [Lentisphaera marina]MDD7984339.1 hypothetical protein [Lentisphaera marina]